MVSCQESIVQTIMEQHCQHGGSTYSLRWGELSTSAVYVVSLCPERGVVLSAKRIEKEILSQFIHQNWLYLVYPQYVVGTWFCEEHSKTYIDVSTIIRDYETAKQLANHHNQIAIWDLKNAKEIVMRTKMFAS